MHEEYDVCFNETQRCDLIAFFKRLEHKYDLDFRIMIESSACWSSASQALPYHAIKRA